jgi:hypothetical protein
MSNYRGSVCPDCGSGDFLHVQFTGTVRLTADGSVDCGDHEFDDQSVCSCEGCDWFGKVGDLVDEVPG